MTVFEGTLGWDLLTLSEEDVRLSLASPAATLSGAYVRIVPVASRNQILPRENALARGHAYDAWLEPATMHSQVSDSFGRILALPVDWDTHGAPQVTRDVATNAYRLLRGIMHGRSIPFPNVVPTSEGGIQLEWHREGVDLEIELGPDSTIFVYGSEGVPGSEFSGEPSEVESRLAQALIRLGVRK